MENDIQKKAIICAACNGPECNFSFTKNDYDLHRCTRCGLLFVWPPGVSQDLYGKDYFVGAAKGFGYTDYDADKSVMRSTFNAYLDAIEKHVRTPGKLLDVGTATGYFLELAKKRGWDATGVEISPFAAEIARNKGLDVLTGTLTDHAFPHGHFDVVTLWDVIEHVADPNTNLHAIYRLLKPNGILTINTPDAGSLPARLLGRRWHLIVPPEHLYYFNRANFKTILKRNGFELLHTDSIGKTFTLKYIVQTLAHTQNFFLWKLLHTVIGNGKLGTIPISINTRDNFFAIARKSR